MPRKGSKQVKQDYKFTGVLYPDSESYDYYCVLDAIKGYFGRWAYMVHDADISEDTGERKKTHVHWVGIKLTEDKQNSPVALSAVAGALGIPERDIEYAKSEKACIRYLVHADDDDKAQYKMMDIQANFSLNKYFRDKSSQLHSEKIFRWIMENRPADVGTVCEWVFQQGLYAEFRRGFAIWDTLIRDINKGVG